MVTTTRRNASLSKQLAATEPRIRVIYVSTYIPRECGIATYTKDLTNAINILNPHCLADIVAIDDEELNQTTYQYPWEVKYRIQQDNIRSWISAADFINQSSADIVHIQHEYGIYGRPGSDGEFIIPFLEALKKPAVVTFHTVLPNPNQRQKDIIRRIAEQAEGIVVMVPTAIDWLTSVYDVDEHKIVTIHHGVPDIPFTRSSEAKKRLQLGNDNIIMGFGLLSDGKGYEQAIEALPTILQTHPKTKLLILGETHPVVARREGEVYRESLKKLAQDLGVESAVEFVDRYLSLDEVIEYLKATDIYITPYHNLEQITSGTLAYAIGAGKACISTPYLYAQAVLSEERGLLVEPCVSQDFAQAVIRLLGQPHLREKLARNAYAYGRSMIWPSVALSHLELFQLIKDKYDANA